MSSTCCTNFVIGQTAVFEGYFRTGKDCPLIDVDENPLPFEIKSVKDCGKKKEPEVVVVYSGEATKVDTGHYKASWEIPANSDPKLQYKIVWKAHINEVPVNAEELFTVTAPVFFSTDKIIEFDIDIPLEFMEIIKTVLAYPCADEILLNDDNIKKLCIYPAFLEFFTKFPIKVRDQRSIGSYTVVPFPDQFTYGATQCSVNGKQSQALGHQGNFYQLLLINKGYGFTGGSYGSYNSYGNKRGMRGYGFNPNGLRQTSRNYKYVLDTLANENTFNYFINLKDRQIEVEATTAGDLMIVWAKWSNKWKDIPYPRRMEVVKLAQSYLLQQFVDSVQITDDGNTEQSINYAELQTRATDLRTEVMDLWKNLSSVVVTRGA